MPESSDVPFLFTSAQELLQLAEEKNYSISETARLNEQAFRTDAEISDVLQKIWRVMQECVERGCQTNGILPGGLNVERRAPAMHQTRVDWLCAVMATTTFHLTASFE